MVDEGSSEERAENIRVRVWFGETAIADHVAAPEAAERYAAAMGRRFSGLRITCDRIPRTAVPPVASHR